MPYITAEELAGATGYMGQLDPDDADTATKLTAVIARAENVIDGYLGFSYAGFDEGTVKNVRAGYGPYLLIPAHSIGSVSLVTTIADYDLDGQWVELDSGILYAVNSSGQEWNWNAGYYKITAEWGYGDVPDAVKEVTLELAVNIWRSAESGRFTNVIGASDGGGGVGYEGALTPFQKMALDNAIRAVRHQVI